MTGKLSLFVSFIRYSRFPVPFQGQTHSSYLLPMSLLNDWMLFLVFWLPEKHLSLTQGWHFYYEVMILRKNSNHHPDQQSLAQDSVHRTVLKLSHSLSILVCSFASSSLSSCSSFLVAHCSLSRDHSYPSCPVLAEVKPLCRLWLQFLLPRDQGTF